MEKLIKEKNGTRRIITASEARAMSDAADSMIKDLSKWISSEAKRGHTCIEVSEHNISDAAINRVVDTFVENGFTVTRRDDEENFIIITIAW